MSREFPIRVQFFHAGETTRYRRLHPKVNRRKNNCTSCKLVTSLLSNRYQDAFALLVPSCCDKSGTLIYCGICADNQFSKRTSEIKIDTSIEY
jgi:hypothetical protein